MIHKSKNIVKVKNYSRNNKKKRKKGGSLLNATRKLRILPGEIRKSYFRIIGEIIYDNVGYHIDYSLKKIQFFPGIKFIKIHFKNKKDSNIIYLNIIIDNVEEYPDNTLNGLYLLISEFLGKYDTSDINLTYICENLMPSIYDQNREEYSIDINFDIINEIDKILKKYNITNLGNYDILKNLEIYKKNVDNTKFNTLNNILTIQGHGNGIFREYTVPEGIELYFLSYSGEPSAQRDNIIIFNQALAYANNEQNFFEDIFINNTIDINKRNWSKNIIENKYKNTIPNFVEQPKERKRNWIVPEKGPNGEDSMWEKHHYLQNLRISKYVTGDTYYDVKFIVNGQCGYAQYGIYRLSSILYNNSLINEEMGPYYNTDNTKCVHLLQYINDTNNPLKDENGKNLIDYKYFYEPYTNLDEGDDLVYGGNMYLSNIFEKINKYKKINFNSEIIKIIIGVCRPGPTSSAINNKFNSVEYENSLRIRSNERRNR